VCAYQCVVRNLSLPVISAIHTSPYCSCLITASVPDIPLTNGGHLCSLAAPTKTSNFETPTSQAEGMNWIKLSFYYRTTICVIIELSAFV